VTQDSKQLRSRATLSHKFNSHLFTGMNLMELSNSSLTFLYFAWNIAYQFYVVQVLGAKKRILIRKRCASKKLKYVAWSLAN
jgi:hypothetical protein